MTKEQRAVIERVIGNLEDEAAAQKRREHTDSAERLERQVAALDVLLARDEMSRGKT